LRKGEKMAGYLHRTATTAYPCYLPVLGEFSRSWPYKTCRCKYREVSYKDAKVTERRKDFRARPWPHRVARKGR
jgi:hypothetical protein